MPVDSNFTPIFSKNWKVNFTQCTPNGYLKYTELCNMLQLTGGDHAESGGLSFSDMQVHDQAWVLSRIRVEIDRLPKWGDTVTIKTWINDLQGSRSVRALEIYLNNEKIIGSTTFWAVFNTRLRRPEIIAFPHEHFFTSFSENRATKENFSKIDISRNTEKVFSRKTVLSDLDIVNHVNNVKYLEWCLDLVDYEAVVRQKIKSFDMNFLKELKYGDTIDINQNTGSEETLYTISKEDKICFALQLNWK